MRRRISLTVTCIVVLLIIHSCGTRSASDLGSDTDSLYSGPKFEEHIRTTEALTPGQQQKAFKLPEGFEISLFASEPDIGKPINIAFDAKGRMWVTQSFEYPFAAAPGTGKDRLTILEDTDGDGKADKFTNFTDTLNIPIGIWPVKDGAIAYSIPDVTYYTDANGDGKPESQQKILGPFTYDDTHGMVNNFLRGYDGWMYACHGFSNRSKVAGADGKYIELISGNTIRFDLEGKTVQHHTHGRINPFGLAFDEMGYMYSTDCHTSPIYQLINGGDYMQWGKEEGMAFAPDMKPFDNEATALAGMAYYGDNLFPDDYQKNLFIGDAVSSKVYRNSFTFTGSTPIGKKEADFILSKDPWFRPVDVKLGPDGAIYIADFYNSIIGHYEVPLDHPQRDRIRGRIWKVTYKGKTHKNKDLSSLAVQALLEQFSEPNIKRRMAAADELADRWGKAAAEPVSRLIAQHNLSPLQYIHGLWVLERIGALSQTELLKALKHDDALIRLHALRIVAGQSQIGEEMAELLYDMLNDVDVHVQRAAVEAVHHFSTMKTVHSLIDVRKKVKDSDSHLVYTLRLNLRNHLRNPMLMQQVANYKWSAEDAEVIASVLVGVQTEQAAQFLFDYNTNHQIEGRELDKTYTHMARFIATPMLAKLVEVGKRKAEEREDLSFSIFRSLHQGIHQRGAKQPANINSWGRTMMENLLAKQVPDSVKKDNGWNYKLRFMLEQFDDIGSKLVLPKVAAIVADGNYQHDLRAVALGVLLKVSPEEYSSVVLGSLNSTETSTDTKRAFITKIGELNSKAAYQLLSQVQGLPPDLQQPFMLALTSSSTGKDVLLQKVKIGELFARTLIEPRVEERFMLNASASQRQQYLQLTQHLDAVSEEKEKSITNTIELYQASASASVEKGKAVFTTNCAPCHSIESKGGSIGPQLDGVGKWGLRPLVEKVLDPNRNVAENFRTYTIKLKDGKVLTGLYRREESAVIVFADITGTEFSVNKNSIAEQVPSKYTVMPDQFGNIIKPEDFNDLVAYLLSQN